MVFILIVHTYAGDSSLEGVELPHFLASLGYAHG